LHASPVRCTEAPVMKIHEYQAKEILRGYGVAVPRGKLVRSAEEAVAGDGGCARHDFQRGHRVVVLEPGWDVEGLERAATPAGAVEAALADLD